MAISKVQYKSSAEATPVTWMDATTATAAAADITAPKTAMLADGVMTTGTGSGGGGTVEAEEKDVNFIDYDGTIVYSYTKAEFANLSAMPANPSHTGLTAQGWNWTLSVAKTYVATYGKLWIGQMYVTTSGDTEIDIELTAGRLSPYLGIAVNGSVNVDWGDNTTGDTVTGSSLSSQKRTLHTYSAEGKYTITIHVVSGNFSLYATSTYSLLNKNSTTANDNKTYAVAVKAVRVGNNATIGSSAFYYCYALTSITMPNSVTSIGTSAFSYCHKLTSITIPSDVSAIPQSFMSNSGGFKRISIPRAVTSIANSAFWACVNLSSISIPDNVESIADTVFSQTYSLRSITIPSSVTTLGSTFNSCHSLASIRFLSQSPPTVTSSTAFTNVPTDCVIYVPYSADHSILAAYTSATNYPSSSTYTYVEE